MTTRRPSLQLPPHPKKPPVKRQRRDPRRNMERTQVIPVAVQIRDKEARARSMLATAATMQLEAYRLISEAQQLAAEMEAT